MKKVKKEIKVSVIYNRTVKTKAELRAESEALVKAFLRKGGVIEQGRKARVPKSKMTCKSTRGFVRGTSGIATGFPRKMSGVE